MTVEHHPLIKDFPELRERLHALKSDAHFAHLERDYEALDKQIVRSEIGAEAVSDSALEQLKQQRLRLKDQLYAMLRA